MPLAIRLGRTCSVPKVLRKRRTVEWYTTPIWYTIPPCMGNIITFLQSHDSAHHPTTTIDLINCITADLYPYPTAGVIYFFPFFFVIM